MLLKIKGFFKDGVFKDSERMPPFGYAFATPNETINSSFIHICFKPGKSNFLSCYTFTDNNWVVRDFIKGNPEYLVAKRLKISNIRRVEPDETVEPWDIICVDVGVDLIHAMMNPSMNDLEKGGYITCSPDGWGDGFCSAREVIDGSGGKDVWRLIFNGSLKTFTTCHIEPLPLP